MRVHEFQPGRGRFPVQTMSFGEFNARQGFEHIEHGFLIDLAIGNLLIAMITRLKDQIIRRNGVPEALVIHRLQPCLNVINIFKWPHDLKLSRGVRPTQIWQAKRGEGS